MVAIQGLTNYKYEKMVTKSLYVLNKYFCMRMDVFKTAAKSQVSLHCSDRIHLGTVRLRVK